MKNRNDYFRVARKSLAGLNQLGATLNVTHCTPQNLSDLIDAADTAGLTLDGTRDTKVDVYVELRAAREACDPFIEGCRDHLVSFLGSKWNDKWRLAGFPAQTLTLPSRDADRLATLRRLKSYFTTNTTHANATLGFDAANATTQLNNLTDAVAAVDNCLEDRRTKRQARDTAESSLDLKLRNLWKELESLLTPTDARWLKFIDRIPGDPHAPEQVTEVTATAQPGGIILVDWPDSTRAARYKVLKQVVGVDPAPVVVATVEDSDAQITGVPSGATVQLQIVATNGVGDAPASEVIQLQAA